MNSKHAQPQRLRRWTVAGLVAATALTFGAAALHTSAQAHGMGGFGRLGGGMAQMDPEVMGKRLEAMVAFRLADIDATPEQKSKITAILKGAANDLAPLRGKGREARQQMRQLLAAPTIDRAQIETLRIQQMQVAETVSRRMLQAMTDAAEVLTPEQRVQLAQKRQQRRGHHGHHGHHRGN